MTKSKKYAFALTEFLIATFIVLLAIMIAFEAFMSISKNSKVLMAYLGSYLKSREVIDIISKDCRMAARVMDYHAGYVTTDDCLVLKVPSVDSNGDIIDVNAEFDYIIYRLEAGDLWKTVIPGPNSSRPASDGIFKKYIGSVYISSGGSGLSAISHKSSVTYLTIWLSITEELLSKDYTISAGTTVKLMNYEWEFVR